MTTTRAKKLAWSSDSNRERTFPSRKLALFKSRWCEPRITFFDPRGDWDREKKENVLSSSPHFIILFLYLAILNERSAARKAKYSDKRKDEPTKRCFLFAFDGWWRIWKERKEMGESQLGWKWSRKGVKLGMDEFDAWSIPLIWCETGHLSFQSWMSLVCNSLIQSYRFWTQKRHGILCDVWLLTLHFTPLRVGKRREGERGNECEFLSLIPPLHVSSWSWWTE